MIDWHRLFGIVLTDYFVQSPYKVELEKDLSLKQQFLDVVIIRTEQGGEMPEICDGLEGLKKHNLLTYKSLHEPMNSWSIEELIGHYVNYRKLIGLDVIGEDEIALYAVTTLYPRKLASTIKLKPIKPGGVYELQAVSRVVRVIVLKQIQDSKHNAMWNLFSSESQKVVYGIRNYKWHAKDYSTITDKLYELYIKEGIKMPYTMEDFERDYKEEFISKLTPEERVKGLSTEELLKVMPPEELLKVMPFEVIEDYVENAKKSHERFRKNH